MKRNDLLVSTGLSPQVVTETLWALACRRPEPWLPDRLHILTTAEGARRAKAALLDPDDGQIAALARDYGQPKLAALTDACHTHIIVANGRPVEDVDSPGAHAAIANLAVRLIRDLTRDNGSTLHVSLAGGRKTVGVLLALAMSLFGRDRDRLSHVLVGDSFVSHPSFFYPPPEPGTMIRDRNDRLVDPAGARVRLVEIPFPRLRAVLPQAAFERSGFADVVAAAQEGVEPPPCEIDLARRELRLAGRSVRVPPAQLAWAAA
ncbi:MAG: CRISPR-associated ring nuclease Csm6, partial [Alphaproteobacteria bacterium]